MTAGLIGYTDRISVRSGEKIAFKVSSAGPNPYHAMLVRIVRGDPNPGGPPPKLEDLSELFDGRFASRVQHAWPGSYGLVEAAKDIEAAGVAPGRGADLADPARGRAADRHLAPRSGHRRGLRAGAHARRHGAGDRHGSNRRRQEAAGAHLVSRLGQRRSGDRRAARRPAAARARLRHRRRGRGERQGVSLGARCRRAGDDRRGSRGRSARAALLQRQDRGAADPGLRRLGFHAPHGLDGDRGYRSEQACMESWSTCRPAP